jgi:hypothetical protein
MTRASRRRATLVAMTTLGVTRAEASFDPGRESIDWQVGLPRLMIHGRPCLLPAAGSGPRQRWASLIQRSSVGAAVHNS